MESFITSGPGLATYDTAHEILVFITYASREGSEEPDVKSGHSFC